MPPVVFELPVDLNKLYCKSTSYLSDRVSSFGGAVSLFRNKQTKQKKNCVHFPLSLLFCNHLCKLTAKILISEHLLHAKISQKGKQTNQQNILAIISYHLVSAKLLLSHHTWYQWETMVSQLTSAHLFYRGKRGMRKKNQKCSNFHSDS